MSPTFDHLINGLMNRVTGVSSAVAAHKQLIVSRVTVADGRNHSDGQSLRFETSPGGRATHPTAAPQAGVPGDRLGAGHPGIAGARDRRRRGW